MGEPQRFHPLVGFGRVASYVERLLYRGETHAPRLCGVVGWTAMISPLLFLGLLLSLLEGIWLLIVEATILYLAIGGRSLVEHAEAVYVALQREDLPLAQQQVARIVSRETDQMDRGQVSVATVESVLENGSDAIFAPLFWYLIAGLPGVLLYRGINTLDAMWGYRNSRYREYGWWSATVDDWVNWIPARLTALSYGLVGNWSHAIDAWKTQAQHCKSPNGGVVMAAGAGALQVELGGEVYYHGVRGENPRLGCCQKASAETIEQASELLSRSQWFWLVLLWLIVLVEG